jgi:hypothetical protein
VKREPKTNLPFRTNNASDSRLNVPFWDGQLRELHYRGQRIKTFKSPAENQEVIFAAFQKARWISVIPVPHLAEGCADPCKHLENVVARLNGHQHPPCLRFHVCAYGKNISWEPLVKQCAARKRKGRKKKRSKKSEG